MSPKSTSFIFNTSSASSQIYQFKAAFFKALVCWCSERWKRAKRRVVQVIFSRHWKSLKYLFFVTAFFWCTRARQGRVGGIWGAIGQGLKGSEQWFTHSVGLQRQLELGIPLG